MTNKSPESDKGTIITGQCPKHGPWTTKRPGKLTAAEQRAVECPGCASEPSFKAMRFETVTLFGECPEHGQWRNEVARFAMTKMRGRCPECDKSKQAEKDREERAAMTSGMASRRASKLEELFGNSCIPRRFKERTFANYRAELPEQAEALKRAMLYAERFDKVMERGASFIFHGKPGTGKNHLAAAIANHIIPSFGASVMFISVYELMQRVRATYGGKGDGEVVVMRELAEVDLLVLDEVGVQLGTRHEEVILTSLIDKRYADMRPTLLLSNLDFPELEKQLGQRVLDRMAEGGGGVLAFNWGSYRAKVLTDDGLPRGSYKRPGWLEGGTGGEEPEVT